MTENYNLVLKSPNLISNTNDTSMKNKKVRNYGIDLVKIISYLIILA